MSAAEAKEKKGNPEAKEKKPKKAVEAPVAVAPPPPAPVAPAAPRAPSDPRLKVLKKFDGRFLPKGILRTRHAEIMARWNADEAHTGVTLDELKTLLADWKGTREKPPRIPKA